MKTKGDLLSWTSAVNYISHEITAVFMCSAFFFILIGSASQQWLIALNLPRSLSATVKVQQKSFSFKKFRLLLFLWHLFGIFKVNWSCLKHKWKQQNNLHFTGVSSVTDHKLCPGDTVFFICSCNGFLLETFALFPWLWNDYLTKSILFG